MRTLLTKLALTAAFGLAMTLTFSCSSDNDDDVKSSNSGGGTPSGGGSSSSGGGSSSSGTGGLTGNSGVYIDTRDNQSYNWVKIYEQIWMTRDLNYDIPSNSNDVCYDNNPDNCQKYGRLYTFADAKSACPPGWDMPKKNDWQTLIDNLGGVEAAGEKLKSKTTEYTKWNGTDNNNFNALPAGLQYANGTYGYIGNKGIWWGSSGNGTNEVFEDHFALNANDRKATIEKCGTPSNKHSVRCIYVNPNSGSSSSVASGGSSSSKAQTGPCTAENNTSTQYCSNGTMKTYGATPSIGGKTYKTVEIGTQTWMAENMNYNVTGSKCYGEGTLSDAEVQANCAKYGRLYTQTSAKTALCPTGWRLPTNADWDILTRYLDAQSVLAPDDNLYISATAAKYLKARNGWNEGNGEDKYGFTALPGGCYGCQKDIVGSTDFQLSDYFAFWWSSDTESSSANGYYRLMFYYDEDFLGELFYFGKTSPNDLLSVRCVKN